MTQLPTDTKNDQAGTSALRFDVVAGLTAAAVVLPKAMAYATVAGLPVAVGLYTAFIPMVAYALLGSSRVLSVSSTATLAILTGAQLGLAVPDGDPAKLVTATATLAGLVGVMLLLARLMRLGFVANFISTPVLTGFKAGIGLVIVLDQVPKLLGVHIAKQGFFRDVLGIVQHIPDTSLMTLAVAAATLLVLIGMERLLPHSPAPLVAVGGGIAAAWFFGLEARGISTVGLQGITALAAGGVDEYLDWAVPSYAKLYNYTKDQHYLDVARLLLHGTKSMVALPGRQFDLKGIGWQQEGWRMGPGGGGRGVGGHRFWLPWISANHLYGITGLEEYDPALFKKLCAKPAAAPQAKAK